MADDPATNDPWAEFNPQPAPAAAEDPYAQFNPQPGPGQEPDMSWGDVAGQAVSNLPSSAGQFASNIGQAIFHPIDTASNLVSLGHGTLQYFGIAPGESDIKTASAVGQYFMDRYGSIDGIKHAIATDPLGVLGDASMLFTLGGSAAARAPGIAGKIGKLVQTAGRVTDPLQIAGAAARGVGKIAAYPVSTTLGVTTGAGRQAIETAAKAGYEGGQAATDFLANLRGQVPLSEVVEDAKGALQKIRSQRGAEYRAGQQALSTATNPLSWNAIDDAMRQAGGMSVFKGQSISDAAAGMRTALADTIDNWKRLDPADYHTAEGMDALKQKIWALGGDSIKPGTVESAMRGTVYNAIKDMITKQEPMYAKMMSGYQKASDTLRELEKTLSLGNNATIDTSLRKLQSVLRDNVNTNYGQRRTLADYLVRNGSPTLIQKLAGQSLSSFEPRGLARVVGAEIPWAIGSAVTGNPHVLLGALASLPFASPRVVGTGAFLGGMAARPVGWGARAIGRIGPSARLAGEVSGAADQGASPGPLKFTVTPSGAAGLPPGIPQGSRLLRSRITGQQQWVGPDGKIVPMQ